MLSLHQVEYKRGHDERVSRFTTVADTPELLRAKAGGQLQSDVRNDGGLEAFKIFLSFLPWRWREEEWRRPLGPTWEPGRTF